MTTTVERADQGEQSTTLERWSDATSLGRRARLGAAVISGVLLALSREPVDASFLAVVALVPVLWAIRGARPRRAAGLLFLTGAVYHVLLVSWIWFFGAVALVPFAAGLAGYWAAVGALIGWFARHGIRHPVVTAAVWVVGDAVVSRFPFGGFSWAEIGYALSEASWARSLASWGGVALVTFVIVLVADLSVSLITSLASGHRSAAIRYGSAILSVILAVGLLHVARYEPTATSELRFALIQGNDINRDLTPDELTARTLPNKHFDIAATLEGDFDLVVLPESSLDDDPRTDDWLDAEITQIARRHDTAVLVNATTDHPDGRAENLNLLYDPDGSLQGTYRKRHLVPFGEFVPFRSALEPLIPQLDQIPRDYVPGDDVGLFRVGDHRVATIICFETAFGPLVRGIAREGADVVVVSTNNRSYRRSAQAAQHIELSQMRAAEVGRPILHSSINGITAVIDHDGNIRATSDLFVNSVTDGTIMGASGQTPYVRYGEWVTLGSLALLLGLGTLVLARSRRSLHSAPVAPSEEPA